MRIDQKTCYYLRKSPNLKLFKQKHMSQSTQMKATNPTPMKKPDVYREFILWTAMPPLEKQRLGLETQGAFCDEYKINRATAVRWKERPDFEERVDAILKMWSVDKTPDVIFGIYKAAVKGNPMSQLLWLQYFKKFNPKQEVEHTHKVEVGVNDIRFIIEALPEPLKSEHYANLRKLLEDGQRLRFAGELENSTRVIDVDGTPGPVSDEADHDAPDVPGERADAVATSHKASLCEDMVWPAFTRHHQSASRWWQE